MKVEGLVQPFFRNQLPSSRLGKEHASLEDFRRAVSGSSTASLHEKEYTLVVVTEVNSRRILLGEKHRGFGQGMVNSFGGKVEEDEKAEVARSAVRELHEETGIAVDCAQTMERGRVGTLRFSFEDSATEMVVHLFRVNVRFGGEMNPAFVVGPDATPVVTIEDPSQIVGCEEISPFFLDDWHDMPLNRMFADDSLWLTRLLSSAHPLCLNGFFHFCAGGQQVNSIRHYYMDVQLQHKASMTQSGPPPTNKTYTLEQRLFHALHDNSIHSPSLKEFKEAYAFVNAVRTCFGANNRSAFDVIIDVAGGHGALAALFLITTRAQVAVVVDPARVGSNGVQRAWGHLYHPKLLQFRYECLRTGLQAELDNALRSTTRNRILVVACHACQHLSDEILEISCFNGVHAAVMPCCQKDLSPGSHWKATSKNLGISIGTTMDLLLAGKCLSWTNGKVANVKYDVRMKLIDERISPQNRIVVCRALGDSDQNTHESSAIAHGKLALAYERAHRSTATAISSIPGGAQDRLHFLSGVAVGLIGAIVLLRFAAR